MNLDELFVQSTDKNLWQKTLESKNAVSTFETQLFNYPGRTIWVEINARCIDNIQSNTLYIEGSIADISARKAAEEHAHITATLKERQRLAHDLHDAVSQMLFSSSTIAEALPHFLDKDTTKVRTNLERLKRLNQGALAEMRIILRELRYDALTDFNMKELLGQLAQVAMGRTDISVNVNVPVLLNLPSEVQEVFYRVAQEALNNVVRHAKAGKADIRLSEENNQLILTISDNGRGFDPTQITYKSLGLAIMKERAASIDAILEIDSQIDQGTKVSLVWKLEIK